MMHMRLMGKLAHTLAGFALIALLMPAAAHAATTPTLSLTADGVGGQWQYQPTIDDFDQRDDRGYELRDEKSWSSILGGSTSLGLTQLEFDTNPFVVNNIVVTNNTALTQVYTFGVTLPTTFSQSSFISGEIVLGVNDGNDGNATAATVGVGEPIYRAIIDSGTVATMWDDPYSLSTTPPSNLTVSDDNAFGPTMHLPFVTNHIGITLRFTLTPGDSASVLSRFDVVAIPEPTMLGVLLIGVTGLLRRPRRA